MRHAIFTIMEVVGFSSPGKPIDYGCAYYTTLKHCTMRSGTSLRTKASRARASASTSSSRTSSFDASASDKRFDYSNFHGRT